MTPARPVADVLREEAPKLMSLRGVVGVYEGALPDGRACIVVMIGTEKPEPRKDIPDSIGGYPVKLEFGGEVRPMR